MFSTRKSCAQLHPSLLDGVRQAPLSMGFPKQEYGSGLPFPTPGDLPDPGIKLASLVSPALAGKFFTTVPPSYLLHKIQFTLDRPPKNRLMPSFLLSFPSSPPL